MNTARQLLAAATLLAIGTAPALANGTTFQNGSFASGQTGWSLWGDAEIRTTGNRIAVLSTATTDQQDDPSLPAGFNNNSGFSPVDLFFAPDLAGLAPSLLDIGGFAMEGSAISQEFTATAGDLLTVSFDWAFLTADQSNADYGFIAINDTVVSVVNINSTPKVSSFNGTFGDFNNVSWNWTNASYSYTAAANGAVRLVIGVIDIDDFSGTSEFRVDNISVSAVPEPEAIAMLLAGLGVVGAAVRRRRRETV